MMHLAGRKLIAPALVVAMTLAPGGARADDTAKTSVAAALGVTAASGKSTVSGGAGAIEAGLLSSDAMLRAGRIIASLTNAAAGDHRVLVVGHDQQISLATVRVVQDRIKSVGDLVARTQCPASTPTPTPTPTPGRARFGTEAVAPKPFTPYLSDIAGAVAVDTTIAPIAFTTDDRLLAQSVLIGRAEHRFKATGGGWAIAQGPLIPSDASTNGSTSPLGTPAVATFLLPGEVADAAPTGATRRAYDRLMRDIDAKRHCTGDAIKAAVQTGDALATSLNAADKGALSSLATAEQVDALDMWGEAGRPFVLRIAVEQTGGTAITRSGILYTLGFPGAAVVSAGALVSFRLIDPRDGSTRITGVIRCAVPQTRFQKVRSVILNGTDADACAYAAS